MINFPTARLHRHFASPESLGTEDFHWIPEPFPEFALFTVLLRHIRLCQSGQWLADMAMVVQNSSQRQDYCGVGLLLIEW